MFLAHGNRIITVSMDGTILRSLYSNTTLPSGLLCGVQVRRVLVYMCCVLAVCVMVYYNKIVCHVCSPSMVYSNIPCYCICPYSTTCVHSNILSQSHGLCAPNHCTYWAIPLCINLVCLDAIPNMDTSMSPECPPSINMYPHQVTGDDHILSQHYKWGIGSWLCDWHQWNDQTCSTCRNLNSSHTDYTSACGR